MVVTFLVVNPSILEKVRMFFPCMILVMLYQVGMITPLNYTTPVNSIIFTLGVWQEREVALYNKMVK